MGDILIDRMAQLDDDVLAAIIDSSSSQSSYLARFRDDSEAKAMSAITGIISVAAESALLKRRTGIAI